MVAGVAVALLLMCPCGAYAQQRGYAWWVTVIFEPRDSKIEGIAVRDLIGGALSSSSLPTFHPRFTNLARVQATMASTSRLKPIWMEMVGSSAWSLAYSKRNQATQGGSC